MIKRVDLEGEWCPIKKIDDFRDIINGLNQGESVELIDSLETDEHDEPIVLAAYHHDTGWIDTGADNVMELPIMSYDKINAGIGQLIDALL